MHISISSIIGFSCLLLITVLYGSLFLSSDDGFADRLVIPAGMEIATPFVNNQPNAPVVSGTVKRTGGAAFDLGVSCQPGIYNYYVWVNPGEPGSIFLKAFEVTKGTSLSARRLKERTIQEVGWSSNSAEVLLSSAEFTIYEGDWGKPYAARFEVWFVPNSGKAERKLMDRVFKIEGWQR